MKKGVQSTGVGGFFRVLAALCWLGIMVALVRICHAGLVSFPAPGLAEWWPVPWLLAGALCAADSVLFLAWMQTRSGWFLGSLSALALLTLGIEWCNVQHGLNEAVSAVSGGEAAGAAWREHLANFRAAVEEQEEVVNRFRATESVWKSDGDSKNDGLLAAAEKLLDDRRKTEMIAMEKISDSAATRASRQSAVHPLATVSFSGWFVVVGLLLIKVVAVALAAIVHGQHGEEVAATAARRGGEPSRFATLAKRLG